MQRLLDRPDFGQSVEVLLSALYHRIIRPGDIVIDGGANGGMHTVPMARLVGPLGRVIAYEPQPKSFESLRRWIAYEKLDKVVILRKAAISSRAGKATFYQNIVNDGLSSLEVANDKLSDWSELTVDVVPLDDEPSPGRCSFIKLDIEGGEYNAIMGGRSMIARDRPIIAMEHGFGWAAKRFGYEPLEFIRFFDEIGYCVWDFLNNRVVETNYSDDFLAWEFIAAPAESIFIPTITDTISEFIKNYDGVLPAADWREVVSRVQAPFSTRYWETYPVAVTGGVNFDTARVAVPLSVRLTARVRAMLQTRPLLRRVAHRVRRGMSWRPLRDKPPINFRIQTVAAQGRSSAGITKGHSDAPIKPWNSIEVPDELYSPKGMIGREERRALYWLGQSYYSGQGVIVDAGAFVGASAFCLAAGVARNTTGTINRPCIFSFDYFKAVDDYVAKQISSDFRLTAAGDDYLDIFLGQTRKYSEFICAQQGDFLQSKWVSGPIEILFIDIAKTQDLNSHLIREFFPHLIPGRSIVVHQDFYHCWHPYIHITMEALAPYFEIIDRHVEYQSRLYLNKRTIPNADLEIAAKYAYTAEERLALLDGLSEQETGDMRAMAEVVKLWQRVLDENDAAVQNINASIKRKYGLVDRGELWRQQANEVMAIHAAKIRRLGTAKTPVPLSARLTARVRAMLQTRPLLRRMAHRVRRGMNW